MAVLLADVSDTDDDEIEKKNTSDRDHDHETLSVQNLEYQSFDSAGNVDMVEGDSDEDGNIQMKR